VRVFEGLLPNGDFSFLLLCPGFPADNGRFCRFGFRKGCIRSWGRFRFGLGFNQWNLFWFGGMFRGFRF
jgi:hypothetical protein